jgi:hypothetical protein
VHDENREIVNSIRTIRRETRLPGGKTGFPSADEPLIAAASEVTPARVANLGCRH